MFNLWIADLTSFPGQYLDLAYRPVHRVDIHVYMCRRIGVTVWPHIGLSECRV